MSINLSPAYSIARDLQQQLQIRVANSASGRFNQAVAGIDAAGQPIITLSRNGNVAAGQPVAIIRLIPVLNPTPTIFGQPLSSGEPIVAQFAYELTGGGKQTPSQLDIILAMYQTVPVGTRLDVLEIANGTAVTTTAMDAATPAQSFANLYWPSQGNV